jgi:hypothetical protein
MSHRVFIAAIAVLGIVVASGRARSADDILVRGKNISITRSLLDEEEWCHFNEVGPMKAAMRPTIVDLRVLTSLINKSAVLARATESDRVAGVEKFRANLRDHKATLKLTDEAFEQRLAKRLTVWRISRRRWEERNIENCVMQIVLNREVESSINAEQIAHYYAQHAEAFDQPEMVRVRRVFVATVDERTGLRRPEAQLAEIRARLEQMRERVRGGEQLVEFTPGELVFPRGRMPVEIETVAFRLSVGETSEVLASDNGYQLIQLIEKLSPRRASLEEARARIKASLVVELIPAYMDRIKREAGIVILDEDLKAEELASAREKIASSRSPVGRLPTPEFNLSPDLPR